MNRVHLFMHACLNRSNVLLLVLHNIVPLAGLILTRIDLAITPKPALPHQYRWLRSHVLHPRCAGVLGVRLSCKSLFTLHL